MSVSTEQRPTMPPEAEDGAVPIREVSRVTGINSITLRAWERRYGLLKPLRTAKGHRLYRPEDIERVKAIQSWLVRGLAIGKIKDILAAGTHDVQSLELDNVWHEIGGRLRTILTDLNRRQLEALLAELTPIYPAEVLADELFAPTLHQWQREPHYSSDCQRAFFEGALKEHYFSSLRRQRQHAAGPRVLLMDLCGTDVSSLALILSYGLCVNGYAVDCIGILGAAECVYAVEHWHSEAVIVYADHHVAELNQRLTALRQVLNVPVMLAGQMTALYQTQGADFPVLGQGHQQIVQHVANSLSGENNG